MGSPCPPRWTFAERAAYFGDRMCAFCGHRNPAGARFCNDCASPLHLKPCKQCDGVNDQVASFCHNCGAACPVLPGTAEAMRAPAAADSTPVPATPGDAAVAPVGPQPFDRSAREATRHVHRSGQLIAAAIATMVIVGAYDAYRVHRAKPDALEVASQAVDAPGGNARTATPAVTAATQPAPLEPETTTAIEVPIPAANVEAAPPATTPRRQPPVPATVRASAHQHPVPGRHAAASRPPPVAHRVAAARGGMRGAPIGKAVPPDSSGVMHVSLATCDGDLIARVVCDQRMRLRVCEGRWGETRECASGIANEHGQ